MVLDNEIEIVNIIHYIYYYTNTFPHDCLHKYLVHNGFAKVASSKLNRLCVL